MIKKIRLWNTLRHRIRCGNKLPASDGVPSYGAITTEKGFAFFFLPWSPTTLSTALGRPNRGINKRGYLYTSNCTDDNMPHRGKGFPFTLPTIFILVSNTVRSFGMYFGLPFRYYL